MSSRETAGYLGEAGGRGLAPLEVGTDRVQLLLHCGQVALKGGKLQGFGGLRRKVRLRGAEESLGSLASMERGCLFGCVGGLPKIASMPQLLVLDLDGKMRVRLVKRGIRL